MKQQIKTLLIRTGLVSAILRRRAGSYILMFHGITDRESSAQALDMALARLVGRYKFLTLDDLSVAPAETRRPRLFMTFDDGLRNNFTVVYPLLKKHGVPATFFVCPGLVDSGTWIWTHEVRERLRSLEQDRLSLLGTDVLGASLSVEAFVDRLKELPVTAREGAVQRVCRATSSFRPSDAQREAFDLMSWDELRQIDPKLVTIGSHSMTHAMLDSVTPQQAAYEVVESRRALESTLQRPVAHFCYPAGRLGPTAEAMVRQTYRTATTTEPGSLPAGGCDLHRLPRVAGAERLVELKWALFRSRPAVARSGAAVPA